MIFSKETIRVVSIPKKGFLGVQKPPGGAPRGSQHFFGVKITSKMKSAPSNYSDDKFSAKSNNF